MSVDEMESAIRTVLERGRVGDLEQRDGEFRTALPVRPASEVFEHWQAAHPYPSRRGRG